LERCTDQGLNILQGEKIWTWLNLFFYTEFQMNSTRFCMNSARFQINSAEFVKIGHHQIYRNSTNLAEFINPGPDPLNLVHSNAPTLIGGTLSFSCTSQAFRGPGSS
jgi:translation initiation factor 2 beta subunit (eIF-2beta)/eIF-5